MGGAALGVALLILAGSGSAVAGDVRANTFTATEFQVLGSSASARWENAVPVTAVALAQIGGEDRDNVPDEFGTRAPDTQQNEDNGPSGPSHTGERVKAGLLSAVLPGAGQYYNGQHQKAYIMGGVEVAIWTAYIVFDKQGDNKREDAEQWAGIYAGTSGSHSDRYWQNVGHYANSDDFNESVRREARATGVEPTGLISGSDTWQWVNESRQLGYSQLRADGNSAYDRRDFMILFAVVNRAVSVVDAVIGAGHRPGVLDADVMGLNIGVEMVPSWRDPGARWVVTRSF